jgi:hypothetical protein
LYTFSPFLLIIYTLIQFTQTPQGRTDGYKLRYFSIARIAFQMAADILVILPPLIACGDDDGDGDDVTLGDDDGELDGLADRDVEGVELGEIVGKDFTVGDAVGEGLGVEVGKGEYVGVGVGEGVAVGVGE